MENKEEIKSERYWTFVCENNNRKKTWIEKLFGFKDSPTDAIIFGSKKYGLNNSQPNKGIRVSCSESSHGQVRGEVSRKAVNIFIESYFTKTRNQLSSHIITIKTESPNGDFVSRPFRPLLFKTPIQLRDNEVFINNGYKVSVDNFTEIIIPLIPGEYVVLICRVEPFDLK